MTKKRPASAAGGHILALRLGLKSGQNRGRPKLEETAQRQNEYADTMEYVDLFGQRSFAAEKLQKVPVFTSERLLCDQYCLEPGQAQRVHTHTAEDKIYVVLEGEALFEVGGEQELLAEGSAVIARAGVPHGVRNDSDSELVLLVMMAPKPASAQG